PSRGNIKYYLKECSNNVRNYYVKLLSDDTVSVAIRLATRDSKPSNAVVYRTYGRSTGLNPNRQNTSEDISINEGIPRYLADQDFKGVLMYNNIEEAARIGAFKKTRNEEKYKEEVVSMMVAPLNSWSVTKQKMIGIIYVTSRKNNAFSVKHVDSMRFMADLVAQSIASIVHLNNVQPSRRKK
ncbi:GAF domain-containing protein, partial [Nitrospirota bacterium]